MIREEALHHIKHSFVYGDYELPTLDRERVLEALEQEPNIDELRAEITALQNRCYSLTKGVMCGFCRFECRYKAESEPQEQQGENT